MKRNTILLGAFLLAAGLSGTAQYLRRDADALRVTTAAITRGAIVESVSATGTLEAVTTVEVGTQVSGSLKDLLADYNQIVKKGEILARLDPSLFEAQVAQASASLEKALSEVQRLEVARQDAAVKLERARQLSARELIAATDLEAAQVARRSAEAELGSVRASATQARASLNQARVNLGYTIIRSPIDGIVVSRNVDVGQTVAASMSAPTLYVLAADLTQMQVNASVDEADVGRVRPGQRVSFRVDAYPELEFDGTVRQVRLEPTTEQNVVTYTTVIGAANPEMLLKPGMTANISIELARTGDVLVAPAAAVRFKPTAEMFAALGQPAAAPASGKALWLMQEGSLRSVPVRTGRSDGTRVEIVAEAGGPLPEGTPVITSASLAGTGAARAAAPPTQNPFVPAPPRPGGGGARGSLSR